MESSRSPTPIMAQGGRGEEGRRPRRRKGIRSKRRRRRRKRLAANAETIRPSRGEENVGRTECKMETAKKRSQESGGAKEKKEDGERGCGEGRGGERLNGGGEKGGPCPELPRGLYGSFDLRRSSLLPRSIDTSYFYG